MKERESKTERDICTHIQLNTLLSSLGILLIHLHPRARARTHTHKHTHTNA